MYFAVLYYKQQKNPDLLQNYTILHLEDVMPKELLIQILIPQILVIFLLILIRKLSLIFHCIQDLNRMKMKHNLSLITLDILYIAIC